MKVPVRPRLFGYEGEIHLDKRCFGSLHHAGPLGKPSKLGWRIFDSRCSYIRYLTCRKSKTSSSDCYSEAKI